MNNVSEQLIKDLIDQGVDTFFGIQGGACARLIENVVKFKGKFIPVLNEQSAGFYAHGYYMATKKTAGLIFTTGPGLTNGLSGIAACFYDRVPLVTLVGQVVSKINIAKSTNTRMVGFQEVPHLELCKPISDHCYKIDSKDKYFGFRNEFLKNLTSKVQVIEFLDDMQRVSLTKKVKKYKKPLITSKTFFSEKNTQLIKKSKKPIIILGSGFAQIENFSELLKSIKNLNIKISCTWGGQKIQKFLSQKDNFIGLMGNHNPGVANSEIRNSDLVISLGCSLLQHQVGKNHSNFAPNAKIIYVNNDLNECKRAKLQFGKRLIIANLDISNFINHIKKLKKIKIKVSAGVESNKSNYPVNFLKSILKNVSRDSLIFADAGATLSWTYQAANNIEKCPSIFTSFNLHSMGYANCASIGASITNKNVYCVIGDGSIPMNIQEFAWLKYYKVKIIVLDNEGYGIIRQTQRAYYKSKFFGSDFKNNLTKLPKFNLKKIMESYDLKTKIVTRHQLNKKIINNFINSKKSEAIIIKVNYSAEVKTSE